MTARAAHRLRPRAGSWVPMATSGLGGLRCVLCDQSKQAGWGFVDAGQITTTSAFVCDDCIPAVLEGKVGS